MADVSVIIPLHQGAATIAETLDSCERQRDGLDVEIIVVDDRSSDGGPVIADAHHARPSVMSSPAPGPSAARNAGLASASSQTIIFCDADDLFAPGAIPARLGRIASARGPQRGKQAFLVSGFDLLWPNGRRTMPEVPALDDDPLRALVRRNQGPPIAWTFPRALLGDAPFREELRFFEDWALALDLAFDGAELVHHASIDCTYRQRFDMAMGKASAPAAAIGLLQELASRIVALPIDDVTRRGLEQTRADALSDMWLWRATFAARGLDPLGVARGLVEAGRASPARIPFIPVSLARRALAHAQRRRATSP